MLVDSCLFRGDISSLYAMNIFLVKMCVCGAKNSAFFVEEKGFVCVFPATRAVSLYAVTTFPKKTE